MSLPKEGKKSLNLERDLALRKEDFEAMRTLPPHDPQDLESYLDLTTPLPLFLFPPFGFVVK